MAASEYLSTKAENAGKNALKASLYTGTTYIFTVMLLILPYLIFNNQLICLGCTLAFAVLVIAVFNFYISIAKDQHFKSRFFEMTGLSFGVAALSFAAGFLLRKIFGAHI